MTEGLSAGERALWLLQRLAPDRGVANVAMSVAVSEPLRWWPLREGFRWLVARHPALRSRFPLRDGEPVRLVAGEVDVDLDLCDARPDTLRARLRAYAGRPFDVERGPLVRLGLFRVGPREQVCVLAAHHIVIDAASLGLLLAELNAGYDALALDGRPPELPVPPAPSAAASRPESLGFWRQRLAGVRPEGMRLAAARPVADPPTFAGDEVTRLLADGFAARLGALRRRCRGTDAAVLLAAYLLALRAQGAADDTLVGVLANTRGAARATGVGYHVATLPLRVRIDPDGDFTALVSTVAGELMAGLEHADVSFETLVPEFTSAAEDGLWWRSGLIRHVFNYRLAPPGSGAGGGTAGAVPRDVDTGLSRFDLELTVERLAETVLLRLVYSEEVHDGEFAEALLERITMVVDQAHADPGRPVGDFDLRTPAERALLDAVNDTAVAWPGPATVAGLVGLAAAAAPDAVAVVEAGRRVGYGQLVAAAGAVTALLRDRGVTPGDVVALAGARGAELAAAALGVWAAGAAYLPLDAEHPADRLRHQLDDSGCRIVLDGHLLPPDAATGRACAPVPPVPAAAPDPAAVPALAAGLAAAAPSALAYLIYTSGSTGRPKGVRLTHANLANVVRHFAAALGAGPHTTMVWLTTFAFDISALELFLPLASGGTVAVAPDAARADPGALLDLVERTGASVVQATPTTWRLVAPVADKRLAACDVLCGGEPLPPALARQLHAVAGRAYNVYGPTETTIWSTVAEVTGPELLRGTVGRPIANTRLSIRDERGRPLPTGLTGELCLGGDGVAEGYHGQPELTAQRFPHSDAARYYRTGDLARLLPDGRVELLGRRDRQVKLHAHRIELGEVEAVLADHPEVRAAAVVLRRGADDHLAAYLVADDRPGLPDDVWSFARRRLPSYSLPARIAVVDELPQTPNGKVDVAALAARPLPDPAERAAAPVPPEPVAGLEQRLLEVWREVLARPGLDRHANFFLNGGTSLMAVRLAERASACGAVPAAMGPVTMGMVFRAPTPNALAALLERDGS